MTTLAQQWEAVQERIFRAAYRSGGDPEAISVVAVTKTRTAREVALAVKTGLRLVGENRVQEAQAKKPLVDGAAQWHLIGHLQSNKAGKAVDLFDMIQSVDRADIARALDRRAGHRGRRMDILVQVNTSGAPHQSGVVPEAASALIETITTLPHLRLRGLMTIGLLSENEARVRHGFTRLRELRESLIHACPELKLEYLSMGMSGDFEWAIDEGANMLRLGSVLFGPRAI